MDLAVMQRTLKELSTTDVTKTVHRKAYPAVDPTRPELSQAGRVVLITGGGTGIGFSIARSFIRASADTIIIIGRRQSVLDTAVSRLEEEAAALATKTKIIARACDLVSQEDVTAFWDHLASQNIVVDVLINNAAKFTEPKPLLELGADEVWSQVEVNAKAPLYFTERFCTQGNEKQKFIVNLTTGAIHSFGHPLVAARPAYVLSKTVAAMYYQLLAQEIPQEKVQIVTVNPGLVYNDTWKEMGVPEEFFEHADLSGGFAVWLASNEAAFLQGRAVWATWDIDELANNKALRKRMDDDHYFLRVSLVGLDEGRLV